MLNKLCDYFDVSADFLLGRSSIKKPYTNELNCFEVMSVTNNKDFQLVSDRFEYLPLAYLDGNSPNDFFVSRTLDDAMSPIISPRADTLLIKKQAEFADGDLVFLTIKNSEGIVRKLYDLDNTIELHSFNQYYPVKTINRDTVKIYGVVTKIIKSIRES
jgi:SOS-response transcriptional repressor LexA